MINRRWLELRCPSYWHYDNHQVLLVLSRLGKAGIRAPVRLSTRWSVAADRMADGQQTANGRSPDSPITDVVDWSTSGQPNEMVTLNALRVLRAAGRLRSDDRFHEEGMEGTW